VIGFAVNEFGKEKDVEKESNVAIIQTAPPSKLKTALRVARTFLLGLWFSTVFGEILLQKRMSHSHWNIVVMLIILIVTTVGLFRKDENNGASQILWFAFCLCLAPVYYQRTHDWAPVVTGALLAVLFWANMKVSGRSYPFIPLGALLSGVLTLHFPWPNGQRCLLTFVFTGFVISLQGIWIVLRYLQGDQSILPAEPIYSSGKSSDREFLRLLHWIFGTIGHIQVFSPELEQRIRRRYQSEIDQLQGLGFDYQFSDGETFPLFRFVLIFPALVVFAMWCKREVMTIHDGTKHLVGHPVYISKNKTAFAEPCGLGTKFYTAFQDGSLLISTTYAAVGMPAGPMIERHGRKAGISDTWSAHQQRIAELEAEGKRTERQTSYQAYAEIEHKETAPL
jgi:hypothetical protein